MRSQGQTTIDTLGESDSLHMALQRGEKTLRQRPEEQRLTKLPISSSEKSDPRGTFSGECNAQPHKISGSVSHSRRGRADASHFQPIAPALVARGSIPQANPTSAWMREPLSRGGDQAVDREAVEGRPTMSLPRETIEAIAQAVAAAIAAAPPHEPTPPAELLTREEAAALLGISLTAFADLESRGFVAPEPIPVSVPSSSAAIVVCICCFSSSALSMFVSKHFPLTSEVSNVAAAVTRTATIRSPGLCRPERLAVPLRRPAGPRAGKLPASLLRRTSSRSPPNPPPR